MPDFSSIRTRFAVVGAIVLFLVAVLFTLQNTQPIRVYLLFFSTEGSAALVLAFTFVLGVIVGSLAMVPARLRDRKRIKKLEQKADEDNLSPQSDAPSASSGNQGTRGSERNDDSSDS